jgi:hypothetical protein
MVNKSWLLPRKSYDFLSSVCYSMKFIDWFFFLEYWTNLEYMRQVLLGDDTLLFIYCYIHHLWIICQEFLHLCLWICLKVRFASWNEFISILSSIFWKICGELVLFLLNHWLNLWMKTCEPRIFFMRRFQITNSVVLLVMNICTFFYIFLHH